MSKCPPPTAAGADGWGTGRPTSSGRSRSGGSSSRATSARGTNPSVVPPWALNPQLEPQPPSRGNPPPPPLGTPPPSSPTGAPPPLHPVCLQEGGAAGPAAVQGVRLGTGARGELRERHRLRPHPHRHRRCANHNGRRVGPVGPRALLRGLSRGPSVRRDYTSCQQSRLRHVACWDCADHTR